MLIRRVFLASSMAVLATSAAAADNWTYSELNKTIPGAGGNAPEDDARPGEYYFMRGVEAFRGKDYEHAIKMYEVAASWGYKNAQYNLGVMYARGQGMTSICHAPWPGWRSRPNATTSNTSRAAN